MPELKPRDFPDLWVFVRVVDTGSFSQAARQMGSTKAAVSKAVARLEGALQVKLLNRSTRRIGLSEAGARSTRMPSAWSMKRARSKPRWPACRRAPAARCG